MSFYKVLVWVIGIGLVGAGAPQITKADELTPEIKKLSEMRVVFHTLAGDLAFAFYPQVAPKTVAQFIKLVKLNVYSSTHFYRIHPGFVAQVSQAQDRLIPLTREQESAIQKIPAEINSIPHQFGVLSMAHQDGDLNSAETSFSIMLGSAPHLDGKFTVFGQLIEGHEVLNELMKVPVDENHRPQDRIEVRSADVYENTEAFERRFRYPHRAAHEVYRTKTDQELSAPPLELVYGLILLVVFQISSFLLIGHVSANTHHALNLIGLLISGFLILILLTIHGQSVSRLSIVLFVGTIGLLRVLSQFENFKDKDRRAQWS